MLPHILDSYVIPTRVPIGVAVHAFTRMHAQALTAPPNSREPPHPSSHTPLSSPPTPSPPGVVFFALVLFSTPLTPMLAGLGMTPLFAAVLVGAAQNIFSKSSKYSLFDPCKEMAYIPLDDETKTKGKAAIDVICNPLGKSGGALIQQFMIIGFGSLAASTPYLGIILLVIVAGWIAAAKDLDWRFSAQQTEAAEAKLELARSDARAAQEAKDSSA